MMIGGCLVLKTLNRSFPLPSQINDKAGAEIHIDPFFDSGQGHNTWTFEEKPDYHQYAMKFSYVSPAMKFGSTKTMNTPMSVWYAMISRMIGNPNGGRILKSLTVKIFKPCIPRCLLARGLEKGSYESLHDFWEK